MTIKNQILFLLSLLCIECGICAMDANPPAPAPKQAPAPSKPFDPAPLVAFLQDPKNILLIGQENFDPQNEAQRIQHKTLLNLAVSLTNNLRQVGPGFKGQLTEFSGALDVHKDTLLFFHRIYNEPLPPQQQTETLSSKKPKRSGLKTFLEYSACASIGILGGALTVYSFIQRK